MRSLWGALAIGLAMSSVAQQTNSNSTAAATATNTVAASDNSVPTYDSFNIIERRNIFDPNRRPYLKPNQGFTTTTRRSDYFALVGTMSYTKGRFAFFDGTMPQYKKVVETGGNISGYTVKEIGQNFVTLTANGKDFQMPVGQQLRNDGQNKWQMMAHNTDEEAAASDTNEDGTATAAATADSSTPPVGANPQMSEIIKKLMQAREQELK